MSRGINAMKRIEEARECSTTAALYALGALPAENMAQFEQRLASGCPLCSASVDDYAEVADQLATEAARWLADASTRK